MYIQGIFRFENDDISDAIKIREEVFQEELKINRELEMDDNQNNSIICTFLVYEVSFVNASEIKVPVATGRLSYENNKYKIGRIAVLSEKRGLSYGDLVVKALVNYAFEQGAVKVYVGAQEQAIGFYRQLGFISCDEYYVDMNIRHLIMVLLKDNVKKKCNE